MSKSRIGAQRYRFKPFEDESHLECICRFALRDRDVGAYFLKYRRQLSFVFGFQAPGIHTLLAQGQAEAVLNRLEEGLKGFRPGDRLRLHLRSMSDDSDRQQELATLIVRIQVLLTGQNKPSR